MKFLFFFLLIPLSTISQGATKTAFPFSKHVHEMENLAQAAAIEKKWEKAAGYFEKLKKIVPSNPAYHYKHGGCLAMLAQESNPFKALGFVSDIRKSFETAIKLDPKHIDARWGLIELYLELPGIFGGSDNKARHYADQLLTISPVDGYLAKGHIAESTENLGAAESYYKKAIEIGQSKTTYQKLADLYKYKLNNHKMAEATMAAYHEKSKS